MPYVSFKYLFTSESPPFSCEFHNFLYNFMHVFMQQFYLRISNSIVLYVNPISHSHSNWNITQLFPPLSKVWGNMPAQSASSRLR